MVVSVKEKAEQQILSDRCYQDERKWTIEDASKSSIAIKTSGDGYTGISLGETCLLPKW